MRFKGFIQNSRTIVQRTVTSDGIKNYPKITLLNHSEFATFSSNSFAKSDHFAKIQCYPYRMHNGIFLSGVSYRSFSISPNNENKQPESIVLIENSTKTDGSRKDKHDSKSSDNDNNKKKWFQDIIGKFKLFGGIAVIYGFVQIFRDECKKNLDFFKSLLDFDKSNRDKKDSMNKESEDDRKKMQKYVDKLSSGNISSDLIQENSEMKKNVESLLDRIKKLSDLNQYDPADYINFLYLTNCLANYYLFHEYNQQKAKEYLEMGKNFVIKNLDIINKDQLDDLNPDQLNSILGKYKDLVEVYAHTLYIYGRTYVYQKEREEIVKGRKYFELSKGLSTLKGKPILFELILCDRGGIYIIDQEITLHKALKDKEYAKAKDVLFNTIAGYQKLIKDGTDYINQYRPSKENHEQKKTQPQNDPYHKIECYEQLLKNYAKLIAISSSEAQTEYFKELSELIFGSSGDDGVLMEIKNYMDKHCKSHYKKFASISNMFGNILVLLAKTGKPFEKIQQDKIAKVIGVETSSDQIELAYKIFDSAKDKGYGNFTEAHSYAGLLMACRVSKNKIHGCDKRNFFKDKKDDMVKKFHIREDEDLDILCGLSDSCDIDCSGSTTNDVDNIVF
jgi:hypothetical protein